MVRQDQLAAALELVEAMHLVAQHAEQAHEADKSPEAEADGGARGLPALAMLAHAQRQQREHERAQQQAAQPEQDEGQAGGQHAPAEIDPVKHDGGPTLPPRSRPAPRPHAGLSRK